jgi:hypothetical protein
MHLAILQHYQMPTQPCIITPYITYTHTHTHTHTKSMMIGTNTQRQSDMKLRKLHKGV